MEPRGASLICALLLLAVLGGCGSDAATSTRTEPGVQRAAAPAISRSDCRALRREAEEQASSPARIAERESAPPSSGCDIAGREVSLSVVLDAAPSARRRYFEWTSQINPTPTPVAGLGGRSAGKPTSVWASDLSTLYTLRGDRWVTVTYGHSGTAESKARAVSLTKLVFQLGAS